MAQQNEFRGYIHAPKEEAYSGKIRLDFNVQIESNPEGAKVNSFNLRLFSLGENFKDKHAEIGVVLRPEEWLDLIKSMKEEFERAHRELRENENLDYGESAEL